MQKEISIVRKAVKPILGEKEGLLSELEQFIFAVSQLMFVSVMD
jgi:hypothetical protein